MTHTPTYEAGDVVTVPFPFTDRHHAKRRPAVVLSAARLSAHARQYVLAMVTSAEHERWPFDVRITDSRAAGLSHSSIVRWKLFSLDASLVIRRIGGLSIRDRRQLRHRMAQALLPSQASPGNAPPG
ncbi:MAG: type II toxin-antitoxin system PemK/MazF family toxin [Gemmatimonadetes bacterium]|nr:type II toxin-antitoxin system PemK/MazF family toxin [Gemmatimonadota bacterium]